jgi:hypothetical protein
MKIALYHNQDIHYEMLGYLIEYCQSRNLDYDLYSSYKDSNTITWTKWYNKFFNNKVNWINSLKINDNVDYDVIVLITDDNLYANYVEEKHRHKAITIDHWYLQRNNDIRYHIGIRKFYNRPNLPYTIPCYRMINKEEKLELVKNDNKIKVIFLGRYNIPSSLTFLLFDNIKDIEFHIVRPKEDKSHFEYLKNIPNSYFYYNLETDELMELMKKCHYTFLMPSYIEGYQRQKLSSIIPLSYSTLCQCIIPKSWNMDLNLKSVLLYDDLDYLQPNKQIKLDINQFKLKISEINEERESLITHNIDVFDCAIDYIINKNQNNDLSRFSLSCQRLGVEKPKIYLETTINSYLNISKVLYEFDEIHSIQYNYNNDSIEIIKNYSHLKIYHEDKVIFLSELSKNIQESIFFYLDTFDLNNILDQLKIIGQRKFDDYIIVNNITKWIKKYDDNDDVTFSFEHPFIKEINKCYNKKCKIITTNDIDWLIIIPI